MNFNLKHIICVSILCLFTVVYYSQDTIKDKGYQVRIKYKTKRLPDRDLQKQYIIEQSIEIVAENTEDEEIDYTTLFDLLSHYYEHPINLNRKNISSELQQLRILTDFQIKAINNHIEKHGKLVTIYELQRINSIDENDIRNIMPFITVNKDFDSPNISFSEMLKRGKNDMFIRYYRVLEETSGQINLDDSAWANSPNSKQVGSPDNLYMRYRFKYLNNLSIGITAEKDAGETFIPNQKAKDIFGQSTTLGFDFYSAHFYIKNIGIFKSLALGDYHVQIGQGLTFWSGLGFGKSSDIMGVKRNALGIKPYSSVDENQFLRGSAFEIKKDKFNFLVFGSKKMIDANIIEDSTNTDGDVYISSFQSSGKHSTISELENKDAIQETIGGGEISYINNNLKVGIAGAFTNYKGNVQRNLATYSQFQFNSNFNLVSGLNYSWNYQNFSFFGELSRSNNGGSAQIHGVLASLHPRVSISILYRNYGRDYQSVFNNAFAESNTMNERGIFSGIKIKLNKRWLLSSYFDQFTFPWLAYQVNSSSTNGFDGFAQIQYKPNKKLMIYGRIRHRNKPYNTDEDLYRDIDNIVVLNQMYYRFNLSIKASDVISLKSRVEYKTYQRGDNEQESGVLISQDVNIKPIMSKFSFKARFALFDTDSYNSRIYSYESDVLYYYRIPTYYNRGSRTYLVARYNIKKGIDFWIRWSAWNYINMETISSGLNEIEGNTKSEIRAQLRFQF